MVALEEIFASWKNTATSDPMRDMIDLIDEYMVEFDGIPSVFRVDMTALRLLMRSAQMRALAGNMTGLVTPRIVAPGMLAIICERYGLPKIRLARAELPPGMWSS